jgi:hypothetical protein
MREYTIRLLRQSQGEWYDLQLRRVINGDIFAYGLVDKVSGQWLLNVKMSEEEKKAIVLAPTSERTSSIHDQIKRKTMVFKTCTDGQAMYHPLCVDCVVGRRVVGKRVERIDDVPSEIKDQFALRKYEEVSPITPARALKGKLVAVIGRDHPENMALLFFHEKIAPVFS